MPYVVTVTIQVIPEHRDAFIAASRDNSLNSVREPACRQFDVSQAVEDPNRFHLYEVYDSQAGFAAHQQTAHYLRWRDAVNPWMAVPRSAVKWNRVSP